MIDLFQRLYEASWLWLPMLVLFLVQGLHCSPSVKLVLFKIALYYIVAAIGLQLLVPATHLDLRIMLKAGVSKPQLLALLTPDIVQRVALTYLQQQHADLDPYLLTVQGSRIGLIADPCLIVIADGSVKVSASEGDTILAETLATEVEQLLLQLADSLFQQQVQQALGPAVTQVQTVNVDNDSAIQQAAVFTLEL